MTIKQVFALSLLSFLAHHVHAVELHSDIKGLIELSYDSKTDEKSWLHKGWGMSRFGSNDESVSLSRAVLDARVDIGTSWSLHGIGQFTSEPDNTLGFTEAFANYQPIASRYQFSGRFGAFYPKMSLENTGFAWASPYSQQYSALNAWLGEEIRTIGAEFSIKRPARRFRSRFDLSFHGAVFKGNDPAGTLIAWRGFTPHDRQTVLDEKIGLAPLYAFKSPKLAMQWQYSDPFHEIDGRFGYYLGAHWQYQKKHTLRVYWYDNNGDPSAFNASIGQYAWDTKFLSLAWRTKLSKHTHIVMQGLSGNTAMGSSRGVDNDYHSWFALLSHKWQQYRFTARIEQSKVIDKDHWVFDPNASENKSFSLYVGRKIFDDWKLGVQWQYSDNWLGYRYKSKFPLSNSEQIWRLSASYQF